MRLLPGKDMEDLQQETATGAQVVETSRGGVATAWSDEIFKPIGAHSDGAVG